VENGCYENSDTDTSGQRRKRTECVMQDGCARCALQGGGLCHAERRLRPAGLQVWPTRAGKLRLRLPSRHRRGLRCTARWCIPAAAAMELHATIIEIIAMSTTPIRCRKSATRSNTCAPSPTCVETNTLGAVFASVRAWPRPFTASSRADFLYATRRSSLPATARAVSCSA